MVCSAGIAGGRVLALVQGAKPDPYIGISLALEVAIVIAASAAYVSERTRLARDAKEQKRAEKAALEAALAAQHLEQAVTASPSPVQQP
jgi:cell division protein FtsL